jgi:hypothetical protein
MVSVLRTLGLLVKHSEGYEAADEEDFDKASHLL